MTHNNRSEKVHALYISNIMIADGKHFQYSTESLDKIIFFGAGMVKGEAGFWEGFVWEGSEYVFVNLAIVGELLF